MDEARRPHGHMLPCMSACLHVLLGVCLPVGLQPLSHVLPRLLAVVVLLALGAVVHLRSMDWAYILCTTLQSVCNSAVVQCTNYLRLLT